MSIWEDKRDWNQGKQPCEDRGREWSYAATGGIMLELWDSLGNRRVSLPRALGGEHALASTLISEFWPPQLWGNKFLCH